ncbi:uncharacterized protein BP01DRAFT_426680 [Aspergillus saccharolyticus JOP 1030-1]|uniref:C6 transcription factor n=1 Tax=Aspergillus saccharolyticus JOP 1030-1 TaxID=1450539 RepID=A0A318Z8E1_9EURO|nr:hypothetical protein BP01DRAFT_426680 [Aspergillus saccharolyticus JOP 1030-1]PYH41023.1 hypothetical protein BP01DRAFT_426680 [Aspergillus saccharolyticus JOP 1030-1]
MVRMDSATRSRRQFSGPHFEFIAVAGDNVAGDAATRRRVRSHAMVDYRRRTAKPKRKEKASPLNEIDTTSPSPARAIQGKQESRTDVDSLVIPYGRFSLLDASRSDPFGTFPIDCDRRTRRLWDHMYDGTCSMFRTMLDIGFLDVVRETIALSQLLSASSQHLGHLYKGSSTDHFRYSIRATTLLQQRLQDPSTCVTDEVVIAVLAFCCYANLTRDPELLNVHMNGLSRILGSRGGVQSLDSKPLLRTMLYWVDVNGAYLQDSAPRYQQPFEILVDRSMLTTSSYQFSQSLDDNTDGDAFVSYIRQSLTELHMIMLSELTKRDLWYDILFPGFHISPILHVLLSQNRATVYVSMNERVVECFRLATVIYLTELRGKFGLDTIPGLLYGSKLLLLLRNMDLSLLSTSQQIYLVYAVEGHAADGNYSLC